MRIAILGAGTTGVCAALELAERGREVDLYDEHPTPITQAGYHNEGKIHLGLLYAKDPSLRTARTMITGALRFAACLGRWIDFEPDKVAVSTPFYYAVHQGSMVGVERLRQHYARCKELFERARETACTAYLGIDRSICVEELPPAELERVVSPERFVALFRTSERSVDPRTVARQLRDAVEAAPRIHFRGSTRVLDVTRTAGGRLRVTSRHGDELASESYDQVANTLWHGRLEIDARMGLRPGRAWLYRYKLGNRILVPLDRGAAPSITCVLGPFGDIVNFGAQGLYLSWYPAGMLATSTDLRPPEWEQLLGLEARQDAFRLSWVEWTKRCPSLSSMRFTEDQVDARGGVIFAWGSTDIDAPDSELHSRHEIGVHSCDGYHSVNTGKYTMAPHFGLETAERILASS